jgi:hypothetical protein
VIALLDGLEDLYREGRWGEREHFFDFKMKKNF